MLKFLHMSISLQATLDWLAERPAGTSPHGCLVPGDMVENWLVETFLGAGRSAEVYRVSQQGTGREAALKILTDPTHGLSERFQTECDMIRRLNLSGLPRFRTCGRWHGRPYIILEHLLPVEFPMPRRAQARFMIAVARAVSQLHAAGYLHRDLKPSNILQRVSGEPVLIDLGLAKPIAHAGEHPLQPREVSQINGRPVGVGTIDYAAPEQLLKGECSVQSDIFSLGKVARAMFSHRPPHAWRVIIRRATRAAPEDRFPSAEAFIDAIRLRNLPVILWTAGLVFAAAFFTLTLSWPGPVPSAPPEPIPPAETPSTPPRVPRSTPTFAELHEQAARGDPEAQCHLAEDYFYGRGTPTNHVEALYWYKESACAGLPEAEASLGFCYAHGIACEKDPAEAAEWYRLAAEKGHLGAMADLGYALLNGHGVEPDATEAIRWITQAAAGGHASAQTLLGECLLTGRGLPANAESAYTWFERAAAQGQPRARQFLAQRERQTP